MDYVHLLKKSPQQVFNILIRTLQGIAKGKIFSKSLKLATNNAVAALQYAFAIDIAQVLTGKSIKYKKKKRFYHFEGIKFISVYLYRW